MAFVRKSELVTGIFVLVGLLVGGALAIIPFNNFFSDSGKVQFVAYFDDVKLLQPKAQVAINGQPVGIVQSLEVVELDGAIPKESRIRVVFDVEDDVAKMLTKGTKTKIDSESMLGAKFVKILPDLTGVPLPKEGDLVLVETMPYADMFTTFDSLSEGIKPVFAGLQDTLSRLNNQILEPTKTQKIWDTVDSAKAMIDNLDARLAILTSQLTDADGLVPTAKLAIDDARSLLAKLESEIEILRKEAVATMGDARKALDNVDGGISELRESTLPKLDELLDDPTKTARDAAFSVAPSSKGFLLREDKWAYIQYGEDAKGGIELFDMESDPLQYTNLADEPEHAATVERLKAKFAATMEAAGNPVAFLEGGMLAWETEGLPVEKG